MKKIILSGLFLIILSIGGWAEEEPLPTKLPTIVVKGKDKSYLEVIRMRNIGKASRAEYLFEKELSFPSPSPSLEKKASYFPPSPFLKESLSHPGSKTPSPLPAVSFKIPSLSFNWEGLIPPSEAKEEILFPISSKKELSFPSPQVSLGEKVFPIAKEKSFLPYLHLYTYFTTRKNFSYQLNYGRSMEESSYLLSLHRDYHPFQIKCGEEFLDKNTDGMMIESYWDLPRKKKNYLGLETSREKVGLTNQKRINKEKFKIKGGQRSDTFRLEGEIGNLRIRYPDKKQEGVSLRAQTELRIKETSLNIGLNFNGESLNSDSYNEIYLWLRGEGITFSGEKNLILTTRAGIKWVENQEAEFPPYLKILYLINPQMRIQLIGERIFSLPDFEDLYSKNDYARVNAGEEFLSIPRDYWNYRINWDYEISSHMNIYLEVFRKEGNDIIWNQENLLTEPFNRKILLQGGRVKFWHCFNDNFQQEIIFTYYTDREMKNVEDDTEIPKIIPGYPRSKGEFWLKWKNNDWKIEVGGEIIGERYYREDSLETLPSGWKEKLRVSKNLGKDVECSVEWQRNNYELLKDYFLPSEKIILELKARLF